MSLLGARKMRERRMLANTWTYVGRPEEPSPPAIVDPREYSEEEVRIACEWTFVFMLMLRDPRKQGQWYEMTTTLAHSFPQGSYRYCFFWGLRYYGSKKRETLEAFREYLDWKISQFDGGIIRREGPRW